MGQSINIYKDFNVRFLFRNEIDDLLKKIILKPNNKINLNISNCILDYPFVSQIFDKILFHLKKQKTNKKLKIIYNQFDKAGICQYLFLGSKFMNIGDEFKLLESEWDLIFNEIYDKFDIKIEFEYK